jgi:hypothetical protein
MSGDTRHIQQHVELTFKYSEELSENERPRPGKPETVIVQEDYARVRKWHIKRVFYFLTCSSALCLTTVALVPAPAVQATALGIWATSAGLAQFLLAGAYRKPGQERPPQE